MHSLKINNSPIFSGSREILTREAMDNGKKLGKNLHDILSQSQLRAATEELMQDLDNMASTNITSLKLNAQKKARMSESVKSILKDTTKPIINKDLLVDANETIPASKIGDSRKLEEANSYLLEQAAKATSEKLATEKLTKLADIL